MEYICDGCGERNPAGAQFCVNCHAFLAWDTGTSAPVGPRFGTAGSQDRPTRQDHDHSGPPADRTMLRPPLRPPEAATQSPAANPFRVLDAPTAASVPATGQPTDLVVKVLNTSQIVDGYLASAPGGPGWLTVESRQVQLLPGSEDVLPVRLRVVADTLIPAQQLPLVLRIRSTSQATAYVDLSVLIDIPVIDVPVKVRAEPRLLRSRDSDTSQCLLVIDNTGSNRRARIRFSGSDPEGAVQFGFEPPTADVAPGTTGSVRLRMAAPRPEPGQEISRLVTITGLDGTRTAETALTWQQISTVSAMTTLSVRVEPSVVRVRDADGATAQVVVDNRRGQSRVHAVLGGSDPEGAMRLTFYPPALDIDPGQVGVARLQLDSWRPPPGQEQTRSFTVTAGNGATEVTGTGTLVQASSRAAIEQLTLRLEPSLLRLGNQRRATVLAVLDNRGGAQPVQVSLSGDDPENAVRFQFAPTAVEVPPGQQLSVNVVLESARAPVGRELNRPFTVVATDGRIEIPAQGSLIQSATSRRPLARLLFTLFGGLAIIIGALRSLSVGLDVNGYNLMGVVSRLAGQGLNLGGFEPLVSADLVIAALGLIAIFGLTGRSGGLTRLAVSLALLLVVGVLVALNVTGNLDDPIGGAVLAIVGCIAGYIGGKLVSR